MADIGCRCYMTVPQNINSGIGSTIAMTSVRWDTDGMFGAGGVLTSQTTGYYIISGHVSWANAGAVGDRWLALFYNGGTFIAKHAQDAIADVVHMSVGTIYRLALAETMHLIAYQNTGGPLAVLSGGNYSPEFVAQRIENTGCRAYKDALVSIPDSVWTTVALNQERWDTDGCHDNAVNNSRITCQTDGYYAMSANVAFSPQVSGNRGARILLNGATVLAETRIDANGTENSMSLMTAYQMGVGDYIELQVWTKMGVPQNLRYYGNYSPELTMQLISELCPA